jgi:uncharacterized protein (DUF305 family)
VSAEHRIFAKQKAERSAYIQLGDRFVKAGKSQLYKMNHWRESVLEQYSENSSGQGCGASGVGERNKANKPS